VKRLIFSSTATVYAEDAPHPLAETAPIGPKARNASSARRCLSGKPAPGRRSGALISDPRRIKNALGGTPRHDDLDGMIPIGACMGAVHHGERGFTVISF
jgi:hypothetical protein